MEIFSVFHSPGLQLSERINITFTLPGENPMAFFLLAVVQSHAEHVHSLCIVTFKMLLQHLTCFLMTIVYFSFM